MKGWGGAKVERDVGLREIQVHHLCFPVINHKMANWGMKDPSRQAQPWAQPWAQPGLPRASPSRAWAPLYWQLVLLTLLCIFSLHSSQSQECCWVPPDSAEPALGLRPLLPSQRLQPQCVGGHPTPSASLWGPSCTVQPKLDTDLYWNHDLAFVPFYSSCIL